MNEYNERVLKTVLQDYRAENDEELLKEIEEAKNDPFFQVSDEEAKAFALKYVKKQKKNNRTFLKAACFIAAIILAGVSLIPITVQGKKSTIVQHLIYCISSEFLSFGTDDENSLLLSYKGEFVPSYIPEGYYVESVNNSKTINELVLKNSNNERITLTERYSESHLNMDHHNNAEIKEINILGYNGIYYIKDNTQYIVINTDNISLTVMCNNIDTDLLAFSKKLEKK